MLSASIPTRDSSFWVIRLHLEKSVCCSARLLYWPILIQDTSSTCCKTPVTGSRCSKVFWVRLKMKASNASQSQVKCGMQWNDRVQRLSRCQGY